MPDRQTKVTLTAVVSGYLAGMDQAARKTREVGTASEKLAAQRQGFDTLGRSALALGAAAAAGVGVAVARFAEFDKAMSSVQAATHESAGNMGLLREAALEAGESTVYTASEAAGAIESLAKAGISTSHVLGGALAGSLDLAAAGELAVGDAAEVAATAMTQFNLSGAEVPHIADLLAAGAGKAQGSVQDMAAALNQSGLVASQMGLSLEETTGTLAAFASAGLLGSDAGTSFRTMLLRLANPTEESKNLMAALGIAAYDATGQFVGMESIAGQLTEAFKGKTQAERDSALATLFGSDAIRAASVLYSQGAEGIADWTGKVDDSGYAAETAALRLDNLSGDIEKLGGAFDTALIQSGSAANDVLRFLVQTATEGVDAFNDLDPTAQGAALGVGALVAASSLTAGSIFLAIPKVAEFNSALEVMGPRAQKAGRAAVALSKGVGLLAGLAAAAQILDNLGSAGDKAAAGLEATTSAILANDLSRVFEGLGPDVNNAMEALKLLTGDDMNSQMERFGSSINILGLSDQVRDARDAFEVTGEALAGLVNSGDADRAAELFEEMAAGADLQGVSTEQLLDLMPAYGEALAGVSNEQQLAAETGEETTSAVEALGGAAASSSEEMEALADAIRGFGSVTLDARAAERDLEAAVDDATAAFAENGATLDISSEAGRANQAALDEIASSAAKAAGATWEHTGSEDALNASLATSRERLIAAAVQFGMSEDAASDYADQVLATPKQVMTAVKVTGITSAERDLAWIARQRTAYVRIQATNSMSVANAIRNNAGAMTMNADGGLYSYADGGFAPGIIAGGRPMYKFAEPETRWEAFISGKQGQETRNRQVWAEAGRRLGVGVGTTGSGPAQAADGRVSGQLFLDSGTFLGAVDGVLRQQGAVSRHRDSEMGLGL